MPAYQKLLPKFGTLNADLFSSGSSSEQDGRNHFDSLAGKPYNVDRAIFPLLLGAEKGTDATSPTPAGHTRRDGAGASILLGSGRYLRIGSLAQGTEQYLNLHEIEAFGTDGKLLSPSSAALSSVYENDEQARGANNCIDGSKSGKICHSGDIGSTAWIRVDFGKPVQMAKIVITNRLGGSSVESRIAGATVTITQDEDGDSVVWSGVMQGTQRVYTFAVLHFPSTDDALGFLYGTKLSAMDAGAGPKNDAHLVVSGSCADGLNGDYFREGQTNDGKSYYKGGDDGQHFLYFDKDCDGVGADSRWIFDSDRPSTVAEEDLDGDDKCNYLARMDATATTDIDSAGQWKADCGKEGFKLNAEMRIDFQASYYDSKTELVGKKANREIIHHQLYLGQFCVKITTGLTKDNDGYLNVHLASNPSTSITTLGKSYTQGQTVLEECFSQMDIKDGIILSNSKSDGWVGSVMFSTDSGSTYAPGVCTSCTDGTDTTSISVDGNSDSTDVSATCLNGKTCQVKMAGTRTQDGGNGGGHCINTYMSPPDKVVSEILVELRLQQANAGNHHAVKVNGRLLERYKDLLGKTGFETNAKCKAVSFVGHGVGGAFAMLGAMDCAATDGCTVGNLVTFGAPKLFDEQADCQEVEDMLPAASESRFVHAVKWQAAVSFDPVSQQPPGNGKHCTPALAVLRTGDVAGSGENDDAYEWAHLNANAKLPSAGNFAQTHWLESYMQATQMLAEQTPEPLQRISDPSKVVYPTWGGMFKAWEPMINFVSTHPKLPSNIKHAIVHGSRATAALPPCSSTELDNCLRVSALAQFMAAHLFENLAGKSSSIATGAAVTDNRRRASEGDTTSFSFKVKATPSHTLSYAPDGHGLLPAGLQDFLSIDLEKLDFTVQLDLEMDIKIIFGNEIKIKTRFAKLNVAAKVDAEVDATAKVAVFSGALEGGEVHLDLNLDVAVNNKDYFYPNDFLQGAFDKRMVAVTPSASTNWSLPITVQVAGVPLASKGKGLPTLTMQDSDLFDNVDPEFKALNFKALFDVRSFGVEELAGLLHKLEGFLKAHQEDPIMKLKVPLVDSTLGEFADASTALTSTLLAGMAKPVAPHKRSKEAAALKIVGMPYLLGKIDTADEKGTGWLVNGKENNEVLLETFDGSGVYGPFAGSEKVTKTFSAFNGTTSCTYSFRFYRLDSWDKETAYLKVNGDEIWSQHGGGDWEECVDGWVRAPSNAAITQRTGPTFGNKNVVCQRDVRLEESCTAGNITVELSTNLDEPRENEAWAFANFRVEMDGSPQSISNQGAFSSVMKLAVGEFETVALEFSEAKRKAMESAESIPKMAELLQNVIEENGLASILKASSCRTACPVVSDGNGRLRIPKLVKQADCIADDDDDGTDDDGADARGLACSSLTLETLPSVFADVFKVVSSTDSLDDGIFKTAQYLASGQSMEAALQKGFGDLLVEGGLSKKDLDGDTFDGIREAVQEAVERAVDGDIGVLQAIGSSLGDDILQPVKEVLKGVANFAPDIAQALAPTTIAFDDVGGFVEFVIEQVEAGFGVDIPVEVEWLKQDPAMCVVAERSSLRFQKNACQDPLMARKVDCNDGAEASTLWLNLPKLKVGNQTPPKGKIDFSKGIDPLRIEADLSYQSDFHVEIGDRDSTSQLGPSVGAVFGSSMRRGAVLFGRFKSGTTAKDATAPATAVSFQLVLDGSVYTASVSSKGTFVEAMQTALREAHCVDRCGENKHLRDSAHSLAGVVCFQIHESGGIEGVDDTFTLRAYGFTTFSAKFISKADEQLLGFEVSSAEAPQHDVVFRRVHAKISGSVSGRAEDLSARWGPLAVELEETKVSVAVNFEFGLGYRSSSTLQDGGNNAGSTACLSSTQAQEINVDSNVVTLDELLNAMTESNGLTFRNVLHGFGSVAASAYAGNPTLHFGHFQIGGQKGASIAGSLQPNPLVCSFDSLSCCKDKLAAVSLEMKAENFPTLDSLASFSIANIVDALQKAVEHLSSILENKILDFELPFLDLSVGDILDKVASFMDKVESAVDEYEKQKSAGIDEEKIEMLELLLESALGLDDDNVDSCTGSCSVEFELVPVAGGKHVIGVVLKHSEEYEATNPIKMKLAEMSQQAGGSTQESSSWTENIGSATSASKLDSATIRGVLRAQVTFTVGADPGSFTLDKTGTFIEGTLGVNIDTVATLEAGPLELNAKIAVTIEQQCGGSALVAASNPALPTAGLSSKSSAVIRIDAAGNSQISGAFSANAIIMLPTYGSSAKLNPLAGLYIAGPPPNNCVDLKSAVTYFTSNPDDGEPPPVQFVTACLLPECVGDGGNLPVIGFGGETAGMHRAMIAAVRAVLPNSFIEFMRNNNPATRHVVAAGLQASLALIEDAFLPLVETIRIPFIGDVLKSVLSRTGTFLSKFVRELVDLVNTAEGGMATVFCKGFDEFFKGMGILQPKLRTTLLWFSKGKAVEGNCAVPASEDSAPDEVRFAIPLGETNAMQEPLAFALPDVGLPMDLEFKSRVNMSIGYTYNLGFGYKEGKGFYIMSGDGHAIQLKADVVTNPGDKARAKLLFLELDVFKSNANVLTVYGEAASSLPLFTAHASLNVTINDAGSDAGRLYLDGLSAKSKEQARAPLRRRRSRRSAVRRASAPANSMFVYQLAVETRITAGFKAATSFSKLPSVQGVFDVGWKTAHGNRGDDSVDSAAAAKKKKGKTVWHATILDLKLEITSVVENIVKPLFEEFCKAAEPIHEPVKVLTTNIEPLSDLSLGFVKKTPLDLLRMVVDDAYKKSIDSADTFAKYLNLLYSTVCPLIDQVQPGKEVVYPEDSSWTFVYLSSIEHLTRIYEDQGLVVDEDFTCDSEAKFEPGFFDLRTGVKVETRGRQRQRKQSDLSTLTPGLTTKSIATTTITTTTIETHTFAVINDPAFPCKTTTKFQKRVVAGWPKPGALDGALSRYRGVIKAEELSAKLKNELRSANRRRRARRQDSASADLLEKAADVDDAGGSNGLVFNFLNPVALLKVVTGVGKPGNLVTWWSPALKLSIGKEVTLAGFQYCDDGFFSDTCFGARAYAKLYLGLEAQIGLGYDTHGLAAWRKSGNSALLTDGLFVALYDKENPTQGKSQINFKGSVGVGASFDAWIASGRAEGSLTVEANVGLRDLPGSDGSTDLKLRPTELRTMVENADTVLSAIMNVIDVTVNFGWKVEGKVKVVFVTVWKGGKQGDFYTWQPFDPPQLTQTAVVDQATKQMTLSDASFEGRVARDETGTCDSVRLCTDALKGAGGRRRRSPAPLLHSWEWEVVFASGDQYGAVNVGETVFNAKFNRNPMRIIKRLCAGCPGVAQREMYYRRYTNTSEFSVYSSMLDVWSETNNVLGVDFDIFSTLANAETRTNAWSFCNFDDDGVGFPRDCGPYGPSAHNWNSLTLGDGQDVEFSVPISPDCTPISREITDIGHPDDFRGYYDILGCGACNTYCRWVGSSWAGSSGSGGDPANGNVRQAGRFWSCVTATSQYESFDNEDKPWKNWQKCTGTASNGTASNGSDWGTPTLIPTSAARPPRTCTTEDGFEYDGVEISRTTVLSVADCAKLCTETEGCRYFSSHGMFASHDNTASLAASDDNTASLAASVTLGGTCSVQGFVERGGLGIIATLPSECRPNKQLTFNLNQHAATARVDVLTNGQVVWIAAGSNPACPRPAGWCRHSGSTYMEQDCDGDGIADPTCSDSSGHFGVVRMSASGCSDSWPNGKCSIPKRISLTGITFVPGADNQQPLSLENGWQAYGEEYGSPTVVVLGETCSVQGLVLGGSWGLIATLPSECRPMKRLIFNLNQHAATARVDVLTNGQVVWIAAGSNAEAWISLTGITFVPGADNQQPLSLENGWQAYGEEYGSPTVVVLGETCSVQGLVLGGSWGLIATLPSECRPMKRLIFNLNQHAATARVDVLTNGQVVWIAAGSNAAAWISLTGITFVPGADNQQPLALENGWKAGLPTAPHFSQPIPTESEWLNSYDQPVRKECGEQQGLVRHYSQHNNGPEDRIFQMDCAPVGGNGGETHLLMKTNFHEHYTRKCNANSYIYGVDSDHRNSDEDRQFSYKCRDVGDGLALSDCKTEDGYSNYDGIQNYFAGTGRVITGVESEYHSGARDRRFKFTSCKINCKIGWDNGYKLGVGYETCEACPDGQYAAMDNQPECTAKPNVTSIVNYQCSLKASVSRRFAKDGPSGFTTSGSCPARPFVVQTISGTGGEWGSENIVMQTMPEMGRGQTPVVHEFKAVSKINVPLLGPTGVDVRLVVKNVLSDVLVTAPANTHHELTFDLSDAPHGLEGYLINHPNGVTCFSGFGKAGEGVCFKGTFGKVTLVGTAFSDQVKLSSTLMATNIALELGDGDDTVLVASAGAPVVKGSNVRFDFGPGENDVLSIDSKLFTSQSMIRIESDRVLVATSTSSGTTTTTATTTTTTPPSCVGGFVEICEVESKESRPCSGNKHESGPDSESCRNLCNDVEGDEGWIEKERMETCYYRWTESSYWFWTKHHSKEICPVVRCERNINGTCVDVCQSCSTGAHLNKDNTGCVADGIVHVGPSFADDAGILFTGLDGLNELQIQTADLASTVNIKSVPRSLLHLGLAAGKGDDVVYVNSSGLNTDKPVVLDLEGHPQGASLVYEGAYTKNRLHLIPSAKLDCVNEAQCQIVVKSRSFQAVYNTTEVPPKDLERASFDWPTVEWESAIEITSTTTAAAATTATASNATSSGGSGGDSGGGLAVKIAVPIVILLLLAAIAYVLVSKRIPGKNIVLDDIRGEVYDGSESADVFYDQAAALPSDAETSFPTSSQRARADSGKSNESAESFFDPPSSQGAGDDILGDDAGGDEYLQVADSEDSMRNTEEVYDNVENDGVGLPAAKTSFTAKDQARDRAESVSGFGNVRGRTSTVESVSGFGNLRGRINSVESVSGFGNVRGRTNTAESMLGFGDMLDSNGEESGRSAAVIPGESFDDSSSEDDSVDIDGLLGGGSASDASFDFDAEENVLDSAERAIELDNRNADSDSDSDVDL